MNTILARTARTYVAAATNALISLAASRDAAVATGRIADAAELDAQIAEIQNALSALNDGVHRALRLSGPVA